MKFGDVPVAEAVGAILAHSLRLGTAVLKKGRVLSPEDVALIAAAGLDHIVAARLDPGDIREDEAARSEEQTSELQSHSDVVWRLLLEKNKTWNERYEVD